MSLGRGGPTPPTGPCGEAAILPSPFRVLEDEIQQLRDELRETVDENGRLHKLLKERDFEIKHLKKKIEEDRFAFTGSSAIVVTVLPGVQMGWPSCHVGSRGLSVPEKQSKGLLRSLLQVTGEEESSSGRPACQEMGAQGTVGQQGQQTSIQAVMVTPLGLMEGFCHPHNMSHG
jgi:hypothetical protein